MLSPVFCELANLQAALADSLDRAAMRVTASHIRDARNLGELRAARNRDAHAAWTKVPRA